MLKITLTKVKKVLGDAELDVSSALVNHKAGVAHVTLANGREITVTLEEGWEDVLIKNVRKFNKKAAVGSKDGDKA